VSCRSDVPDKMPTFATLYRWISRGLRGVRLEQVAIYEKESPNNKGAMTMTNQHIHEATEKDREALGELDKKLLVARDRIRQVGRKETPGFHWYGRPGTGKTHTVLDTLEDMGIHKGSGYKYHRGHITPMGLQEAMDEYQDRVLVLDDVNAIFDNKLSLQYLLGALGRKQGEALALGYKRQGLEVTFTFKGGIITISNVPVTDKGILGALKSRIHTLNHNPSDDMLIALVTYRICANGYLDNKLTADECREVIAWVKDESIRLGCKIDLRLLLEKAMVDFLAHREGNTLADWHDLVTTSLQEMVYDLAFTPQGGFYKGVRRITKEEEWTIVRAIQEEFRNRQDQVLAWKQRVGKSEKAFTRRLAEVKSIDQSVPRHQSSHRTWAGTQMVVT
jgi:hypothetical protein